MERVKNLLQRLQDLYHSKHQKSAIDIDLMLDYTRVMYADLLEWRKTFRDEPPTAEKAEKNEQPVTHEPKEANAVAQNTVNCNAENKSTVQEEAKAPPAKETVQQATPPDKTYVPVQHDEPAPKEPVSTDDTATIVKTEPEKESIDILQRDATGISFEPPVMANAQMEAKKEVLVEQPAVNTVVVEETPAPPPVEIPIPANKPAQEADAKPAVNLFSDLKVSKDIRTAIGINDKYLFLNELFNNHKSNYEETLDQLNRFATLEEAENWIKTKVATAHKWDKDDSTVEGFYAILRKHFSDK